MQIRLIVPSASIVAAALWSTISAADENHVRAALAEHTPKARLESIKPSPVAGWYLVSVSGTSGYLSEDARYFIQGDMFHVPSRANLTQADRKQERRAAMADIRHEDAIVFAATTAKRHRVTVFTDTDCEFCRKFHSQIALLNSVGIEVRYIPFPRGGPGSLGWLVMTNIWCSGDRRSAITKAKRGVAIEPAAGCSDRPVNEGYQLGKRVGVQGTPTILLDDGEVIGGLLQPQELAAYLDKRSSGAAAAQR